MSDANNALAEVRGWLCDNLSSGDAGKVCGMLSVVSRHMNELEEENAKLRELVQEMWQEAHDQCLTCDFKDDCNEGHGAVCLLSKHIEYLMDELGIEV